MTTQLERQSWTLRVCKTCGAAALPPAPIECLANCEDMDPGVEIEVVPAERVGNAEEALDEMRLELAAAEQVLVAADRVREAYEAMTEGRDLGRLPDWKPRNAS